MSALFTPIKLRGLNLANRIMVAPMCQYSSVNGEANDWHFTATSTRWRCRGPRSSASRRRAVEATGRITPGCLGLYNDVTEAALEADPRLGAQALEGGGDDPARACRPQGLEPHAMGRRAIDPVERRRLAGGGAVGDPAQAGQAAAGGVRCGGIEARARRLRGGARSAPSGSASTPSRCIPRTAISCISSCRRSPTGAPISMAARWQNRMRFPLEVFDAVRDAFPQHKPVGIRVSCVRLGRGRLGPGADDRIRERAAEGPRRRLDRRVLGRRVAAAEDSARPRLPGAVRAGDPRGDRAAPPSPSA